jgi:hypothetical protein
MIAAGTDTATVSKVLRHSTIKLTVDSYGHLLSGVGEQAADKRAALIPRRTSNETSRQISALNADCIDERGRLEQPFDCHNRPLSRANTGALAEGKRFELLVRGYRTLVFKTSSIGRSDNLP